MTRREGASAPKHTPGPWDFELIEEHSVRPTVASVGDYRFVRSGLGARGYDLHGQDEDDARLISAAPDLLEALKKTLAFIDDNFPIGSHAPGINHVMGAAETAIAKAEGGAA